MKNSTNNLPEKEKLKVSCMNGRFWIAQPGEIGQSHSADNPENSSLSKSIILVM
jgi:hypothetical protein